MIRKIQNIVTQKSAIQWTGKNYEEILEFCNKSKALEVSKLTNTIIIQTLEGDMEATLNDWIIKGLNGEFYPCKPDIFEKSYEFVDGRK